MIDLISVYDFVAAKYVTDEAALTHVSNVSIYAEASPWGDNLNLDEFSDKLTREVAVALLHDLVEDDYATWGEITQLLGDDANELVPALKLLTRDSKTSYAEYIDGIVKSGNRLAINVKLYDIFDHLHPVNARGLTKARMNRYTAALDNLLETQVR